MMPFLIIVDFQIMQYFHGSLRLTAESLIIQYLPFKTFVKRFHHRIIIRRSCTTMTYDKSMRLEKFYICTATILTLTVIVNNQPCRWLLTVCCKFSMTLHTCFTVNCSINTSTISFIFSCIHFSHKIDI